ncbi:MAG: CoA transferase [Pseudomonadota bacterium]
MTQRNGPLAGIKVLELAHVMAGPACGRLLADLGADVIKLERPEGEDARRMAPPWHGDEAAGFLMMNRNKRGIAVNLKAEAGKDIVRRLVQESDVLIENFRTGTLDRLGLGYSALSALNPKLIFCEISGYGRTGPYAEKGGFDLVAQAMSGLMSVTGEGPGREPVKAGVPIGDIGAGLFATIGVLAALRERDKTGKGQRVDTSLFEAASAFMLWPAAMQIASGEQPQPMASAHPLDAPYQAFQASDGWFIVGAANQANWLRLIKAMDAEYLQDDPRFHSNPARVENLAQLVDTLTPLFKRRSRVDWMERLDAAGVPTGPINNVADMLADPQLKARGMIRNTKHPSLGDVATLGLPIRFSDTEISIERPAPRLGEHNIEILQGLGFSQDEIEALFDSGAIANAAGNSS